MLNVSLQVVGETPPHLLSLSPVTGLLLAAARAMPKAAAPLEVLATHAANIGHYLFHHSNITQKKEKSSNFL
jgi:hypothetical protein